MEHAIIEYQKNLLLLESTNDVFYTGPMQCFCKAERQDNHKSSELYTLTDQKSGEETFSGPICQQYFTDILVSKILGQSVSFIVVGFNIILKYTIMFMVFYIGEETASQQKATVTRGVFLA